MRQLRVLEACCLPRRHEAALIAAGFTACVAHAALRWAGGDPERARAALMAEPWLEVEPWLADGLRRAAVDPLTPPVDLHAEARLVFDYEYGDGMARAPCTPPPSTHMGWCRPPYSPPLSTYGGVRALPCLLQLSGERTTAHTVWTVSTNLRPG